MKFLQVFVAVSIQTDNVFAKNCQFIELIVIVVLLIGRNALTILYPVISSI